MRLVELDKLAEPYWEELVAGEHEPFGGIGEDHPGVMILSRIYPEKP